MESLSIREAATRLGVSTQTVRKRVHGGDLDAELVRGKFGLEWRVDIDDRRSPRDRRVPLDDLPRIIAHQERVIRRLEQRLAFLSELIGERRVGDLPRCG